jgi:asparagine synthase (glutamine-hydrolysing)
MTNDDRPLVLVYNGELYNYLELKDQLKGKYNFKSSGDTEVLLKCTKSGALIAWKNLMEYMPSRFGMKK